MTRNRVFTLLLIKLGIFYLVMGGSGLGPPNNTVYCSVEHSLPADCHVVESSLPMDCHGVKNSLPADCHVIESIIYLRFAML